MSLCIFWLVEPLHIYFKYMYLKNYGFGIRLPDLNQATSNWLNHVQSVTSFGILGKLLNVSYFQLPHLKNEVAAANHVKLMGIKSVDFPSQLIACLIYSKPSVNIGYYNSPLSHSFYMLKLLSWVKPCLIYTLCLFMASVMWPLSNNKNPNILSSPHGLLVFACSYFSCLHLKSFSGYTAFFLSLLGISISDRVGHRCWP